MAYGRRWIVALLVTCAVAAPRLAAAAGDGEALIQEGIELRKRGDEVGALQRFQSAYELTKTARALAQVGVTEQALGRWAAADRHMRQALEDRSDAWIAKNRAALEKALAIVAEHVGTLDVIGEPAGAEVRIDGELVGVLPLRAPVAAAAGTVVVQLRATGYIPVTRATTIRAGELSRETFSLQRAFVAGAEEPGQTVVRPKDEPGTSGTSGTATNTGTSGTGTATGTGTSGTATGTGTSGTATGTGTSGTATTGPGPTAGEPQAWRRPAIWATGAGAVLFAGLGVAEALLRKSKVDSFNETAGCDRNAADRGAAGCASLYDDGQRAGTLSWVAFGVAGGLAATSLVLYLTRPSPHAEHAAACAPAGPTTFACRLVF